MHVLGNKERGVFYDHVRITKIVTGIVRLVNAHIWDPVTVSGHQLFTATLIVPKSDQKTIEAVDIAIKNALKEGAAARGKYVVKAKRFLPWHDGDAAETHPLFAGSYYLNASSLTAPSNVDHRVLPVTDPSLIASGCRIRAALSFFPLFHDANGGIGCELGSIQKAQIGEKIEIIPNISFEQFEGDFLRIIQKHIAD